MPKSQIITSIYGNYSISMSKQVPQILLIMAFFKVFGLFWKYNHNLWKLFHQCGQADSTDTSNIYNQFLWNLLAHIGGTVSIACSTDCAFIFVLFPQLLPINISSFCGNFATSFD